MPTKQPRSLKDASLGTTQNPLVRDALAILFKARETALDDGVDPWLRSVEIEEMLRLGIDRVELRSLLSCGLIAHGIDRTGKRYIDRRDVHSVDHQDLASNSNFIITANGSALFESLLRSVQLRHEQNKSPGRQRNIPHWDEHARRLYWDGILVKAYIRQPAPIQQCILAAFEVGAWPVRIADPLPRDPFINAKERLHEAIHSLNERMTIPLLHFGGDGTSQGVTWRFSHHRPPSTPKHPLAMVIPARCNRATL